MIKLGLCCLFINAPIRFRATTVRYLSTLPEKGVDPLRHLSAIIQSNLENLLLAIDFCAGNGIGAFRISSKLLPICTHPQWGYQLDQLPDTAEINRGFELVKQKARRQKIRLTFHPDQYVVLNSPNDDVVERSLADLEYHALIAKLLGADLINIHAGGGYGHKATALKRFSKNFDRLSSDARSLLTLENDDRIFTPDDLFPLCKSLNIPFVYDVHHHRCLPDRLTVKEATEKALKTWNREPLFHLSTPKEGWKGGNPRLHHEFIDLKDIPEEWIGIDPLTIDIEAKAKEVAVLRLRRQLIDKGWDLL